MTSRRSSREGLWGRRTAACSFGTNKEVQKQNPNPTVDAIRKYVRTADRRFPSVQRFFLFSVLPVLSAAEPGPTAVSVALAAGGQ